MFEVERMAASDCARYAAATDGTRYEVIEIAYVEAADVVWSLVRDLDAMPQANEFMDTEDLLGSYYFFPTIEWMDAWLEAQPKDQALEPEAA